MSPVPAGPCPAQIALLVSPSDPSLAALAVSRTGPFSVPGARGITLLRGGC